MVGHISNMLISVLLFLMMRSYALVKMSIDPFEISTNEYDTPPDSPHGTEETTEEGNEEDILKEDIKTNNKGGTSATPTLCDIEISLVNIEDEKKT